MIYMLGSNQELGKFNFTTNTIPNGLHEFTKIHEF